MKITTHRLWTFAIEREDGDDWTDVSNHYNSVVFRPDRLTVIVRQAGDGKPELHSVMSSGARRLKSGDTSDIRHNQNWHGYDIAQGRLPGWATCCAARALEAVEIEIGPRA